MNSKDKIQSMFPRLSAQLKAKQSITQIPIELLNKKTDKIINQIEETSQLYKIFLQLLLGQEMNSDEEKVFYKHNNITQIQNSANSSSDLPEVVISLDNPDYIPDDYQFSSLAQKDIFTSIVESLYLNEKSIVDKIFFKAIESVFCMLQERKIYSNVELKTHGQDTSQPLVSPQSLFLNDHLKNPTNYTIEFQLYIKEENILKLVKQLQRKLMQSFLNQREGEFNLVEFIDIEYKNISNLENKTFSQGEYLKQIGYKWYKTQNRTYDILTLTRNILIIQFSRKGFVVNQTLSTDGSKIYLQLYMTEKMLELTAENFKLQKKIYFCFTDLLSLEPVDKQYRPLRLNRRLWNTEEYEVSPYFAYLRPLIIEQIEELNFKRIMRDVGQAGLRSELFDCGNLNLQHDQEGPTDEEWTSFYKYLVHLNTQVKKIRPQYQINNDLALCIDNQKSVEEIVQLRKKGNLNNSTIQSDEETINSMETEISNLIEECKHLSSFSKLSKLKKIKLVKQHHLAHNYLNLFNESLQVANFSQRLLYNIWERFNQKPLEIYQTFSKQSMQMNQFLKWCRYIKNEENMVTLFPSIERLKLSYLLANNFINFNKLINLSFIRSYYCLHDQYELHGQCKNIFKVLVQEKHFCIPKPFDISQDWKLKLIYPWQIPIHKITEYFGEKIGLYFEFTSFFLKFTFHLAIFGIILNSLMMFVQANNENMHKFLITLTSIIFMHWNSFVTEYWNKQQSLFDFHHGQIRITKQNEKRLKFKGSAMRSVENDNLNSPNQNNFRFYMRFVILASLLILLMSIDVSIFTSLYYFNFFLKQQLQSISYFDNFEIIITSSLNYILQFYLDFMDEKIAIWLTDFENFETMQGYEICYIIMKNILFCFSQILPLFLIIFFGKPFNLYCKQNYCKYQSIYVFASFCVLGFLIQALKLIKIYKLWNQKEKEFRLYKSSLIEFIDSQDKLIQFQQSLNREEMVEEFIQFFNFYIMVSLFGCLFPLSLTLFWTFILFHTLMQKFKLLYVFQRPWPLDETQSKFWNGFLQFINFLAILINTGLIAVYYYDELEESIIVLFVCQILYYFLMKYIFGALFGKIPQIQVKIMQRKKYIEQSNFQNQRISNKSQKKKQVQKKLSRFPLYKIFGSLGLQSNYDFETISSSEEIEYYYKKKGKNISQRLVVDKEMYTKTINDINKKLRQKTQNLQNQQNQNQNLQQMLPLQSLEKQQEKTNQFFIKLQRKIKTCTKRIIQVDKLNYEFLHNYFSKRTLNWAFIYKNQNLAQEKIIKIRTKIWKFFFRLNLLCSYDIIWSNRKLYIGQNFIFRKRLAFQSLDFRKYIIQKQSYNRQRVFYQEQAEKKFRKQFSKFGNAFTGEELKEYDQLVVKYKNFIEKKSWLNCRKVVILKSKGVFFHGFRKQSLKKKALKKTLDYYKAITQLELLSQDSLIFIKFNNLIKSTPIHQITFEGFFDILSQINYEPKTSFALPTGKSRINQKIYHSQSLKSDIYKNVIDKSKDTYIFEQQNQKVEEFAFQYFIDEINQIPNIKMKKHLHDILWLVDVDNKNYLMQFFQVRHGQQLQFQKYHNDGLGIFIGESQNYIRLLNIIDQIDDFFIKGYCVSLYEYGDEECKSLFQVLQFRKKYSLNYTLDDLKQFLFANLVLLTKTKLNNISIYNYILVNNEYMILNSIVEPNNNLIHQLVQVIIEMILLEPVEDYLKTLEHLEHPLKYLLYDIIESNQSPKDLIDLMMDQQSFFEIDFPFQLKKKEPSKYSEVQSMIHKINFLLRMKNFSQCLEIIQEFELFINVHVFKSKNNSSNALTNFIKSITENLSHYILKSTKIKLSLDILLVLYFKFCAYFALKTKLEPEITLLVQGLKKCFNQIKIILKQLSFNVKLENLSEAEQCVILQKQFQLTKEKQSSISSFERFELINKLRKNKEYIQSIVFYKRSLKRFINQLQIIKTLENYFNKEFILVEAQLSEIIIVQEQLVKSYYPQINSEPFDHSPRLINFEQSTPLNEEQLFLNENETNQKYHPHNENLYYTQLLYYKFLYLVTLFDSKNEQFFRFFQDFANIKNQNEPVHNYYIFQLKLLIQDSDIQNESSKFEVCEIGKYINVLQNKWMEINFRQQNDIKISNDKEFMKYQFLVYSDIKPSIENRNTLKSLMLSSTVNKEKILFESFLQIKLIHFLLHFDHFQPISITISQQIKKRMKNWHAQKQPTYISFIKLLQDHHKKINILSSSWFYHQCLSETQMFYYLSICFAYSSKHLDNINNKNIKPVTQAIQQIKKFQYQSKFSCQMQKSIQINNTYILNFFCDPILPIHQQYQLVCSYLNCCIKSHNNFNISINLIKTQLQENLQPSIIILGLLHSYLTIQQNSMFNLVLQFSKRMLICNSPIFYNAHDGFQEDLKAIESIYTSNNAFIPYPFTVLYQPTFDVKLFEDLKFQCQYLLFIMQKHPDNYLVQEILYEQIEIIKSDNNLKFYTDLFCEFLLILETLVGDFYVNESKSSETINYKEGTFIFALLSHFKSKFYINQLNFSQAICHSEQVLKYINTTIKEEFVTIKIEKTNLRYLKTAHPILKEIFVQSYAQTVDENCDYELFHLYNNEFINEAVLNHLRITINQEINIPSLELLFQFQLLLENKIHLAYFYLIFAEYFTILIDYEEDLLNQYLLVSDKKKISELQQEIKICQSQQHTINLVNQNQNDKYSIKSNKLQFLEFQLHIYESSLKGFSKFIINNWRTHCANLSIDFFIQVLPSQYHQNHPVMIQLNLILCECYQHVNSIRQSEMMVNSAKTGLYEWFQDKNHPLKGLFYFVRGKQNMWLYNHFIQFLQKLISSYYFEDFEIELITKDLLKQELQLVQIVDQYYSTGKGQLNQSLAEYLNKKYGEYQRRKFYQSQKKLLAYQLIDETIEELQLTKLNDIGLFQKAKTNFNYFEIDNKCQEIIDSYIYRN